MKGSYIDTIWDQMLVNFEWLAQIFKMLKSSYKRGTEVYELKEVRL